MQTSGSGQALRASELTPSLTAFCKGAVGFVAANRTGGVAGCCDVAGSDKAALPLPVSATSSEPAASLASFRCGSGVLKDAIGMGAAAGCGIEGGSDKMALPLAILAKEAPRSSSGAVVRDASTYSTRAVEDVARLSSIGASVLSMPSEPKPASPAPTQPARAPVPNATNTASRRGLFTRYPSISAKQMAISKFSRRLQTATSRAARIITGNSALTTTTNFIAQILGHDELPTCNKQLSQRKARNGSEVQDWKELIRG